MTRKRWKRDGAMSRREFHCRGVAALALLGLAPASALAQADSTGQLGCRIDASADALGITIDVYLRNGVSDREVEVLQRVGQRLATVPQVILEVAGLRRSLDPNLPPPGPMPRVGWSQSWMVVPPTGVAFFGSFPFQWPAFIVQDPLRFSGAQMLLSATLSPQFRDAAVDAPELSAPPVQLAIPSFAREGRLGDGANGPT